MIQSWEEVLNIEKYRLYGYCPPWQENPCAKLQSENRWLVSLVPIEIYKLIDILFVFSSTLWVISDLHRHGLLEEQPNHLGGPSVIQ